MNEQDQPNERLLASGLEAPNEATEHTASAKRSEEIRAAAAIDDYLDRLCARVRAKNMHPELREEMHGHIDELMLEKEEEGFSPTQAAAWALVQMGDANEVGGTLGQVHRPKFNWKLLIPIVLMMGIGLLALFSLAATSEGPFRFFNPGSTQLAYYALGFVSLICCTFLDYRLLSKYSGRLYVVTALLTLLFFGFAAVPVNGTLSWVWIGPIAFNWTLCMFVLFLTALPALLERLSLKNKKWTNPRQLAGLGAIGLPVALYVYFDLLSWLLLAVYLVAASLLYARSGGAKIYVYGLPVAACAWMIMLYFRYDHWQSRIQAVFAPHLQTPADRYMNDSFSMAIREGGWFGQGFGTPGGSFVYAYADSILPYLTYSFGWIAAGLVVVCVVWLIVLLVRSVRNISDNYGQSLALALSVLLAGQWIYGIGASFNLLPFTALIMPFIGYGSSSTVIHCAILGLILGIYRRKDMIPSTTLKSRGSGKRLLLRIGGFELYDNRPTDKRLLR